MSVMSFRPVSLARRRQITMLGLKLVDLEGVPLDEETEIESTGIRLRTLAILDTSTGESVGRDAELLTTKQYTLVGFHLTIAKVSGQNPVIMLDVDREVAAVTKAFAPIPTMMQGWENNVTFTFTPSKKIAADMFFDESFGRLLIWE